MPIFSQFGEIVWQRLFNIARILQTTALKHQHVQISPRQSSWRVQCYPGTWWSASQIWPWLACVANVPARFRLESWDAKNRYKGGGGRGEKEVLLPSHSPFFHFFAVSNFRAIIQLKTLVTQASHDHFSSRLDKSWISPKILTDVKTMQFRPCRIN